MSGRVRRSDSDPRTRWPQSKFVAIRAPRHIAAQVEFSLDAEACNSCAAVRTNYILQCRFESTLLIRLRSDRFLRLRVAFSLLISGSRNDAI
jgi:hypothetical protein